MLLLAFPLDSGQQKRFIRGVMEYTDKDSQQLIAVIEAHLQEARERVDFVNARHFANFGSVFSKHLRNWRDAPADVGQPFVGAWNFVVRKPAKKAPIYLPSRKQAETRAVIINELLDLPSLEEKFRLHLLPFGEAAESEIESLLERVPQNLQTRTETDLKIALENLNVPVEAMRDLAAMFLISGAAAAWGGNKFAFGSIAAGQTLATSMWIGSLSWFGNATYWFSGTALGAFLGVAGVPGWVVAAGAASGVITTLILVPVIGPFCEWGVGSLKGKTVLNKTIDVARNSLLGDETVHQPDGSTIVSKAYQYVDMLKNLVDTVRAIVP